MRRILTAVAAISLLWVAPVSAANLQPVTPGQLPAPIVYPFTGDGSTTAFTYPNGATVDPTKISVAINGVPQTQGASFTSTSTVLTFGNGAPPAGTSVKVTVGGLAATVPNQVASPLSGKLAAIPTSGPGAGLFAEYVVPSNLTTPPGPAGACSKIAMAGTSAAYLIEAPNVGSGC